eukprot:CAMPEP_0119404516 /NCGR_PEP_ID=MMETSP1334-20130426/143929_1 /TAXON_ID=127549 /ORGANISM="Calcidiscus leptoporus, Strain RCC1130" /LENGTH=167 /DNA_ID=CAMNT_0007428483 /DNA_START=381 /DNA_END=884 /DNA_ORIENTATION=-
MSSDKSFPVSMSTYSPSLAGVIKQVEEQWGWFSDIKAFDETNSLRRGVTWMRESFEGAASATKALGAKMQATVEWAQRPSETRQRCWNQMLEYRRKYPGAIVGVFTALCLLPGIARKPSPRVLLRNMVIGGGVASTLLYPELVMRTAPYVMSKANQLEHEVGQRISR